MSEERDEAGAHLKPNLSYGDYLGLDRLLAH